MTTKTNDKEEQQIDKFRNAILLRISADGGHPLPMKLDPIPPEFQFPLDLTDASNHKLGQLNSYWAAQLARAHFSFAEAEIRKLYCEEKYNRVRSLGLIEVSSQSESRQLKDILEGQVELREDVKAWKQKLIESQALDKMMKGVVEQIKGYVFAISREMSRRKDELELEREG